MSLGKKTIRSLRDWVIPPMVFRAVHRLLSSKDILKLEPHIFSTLNHKNGYFVEIGANDGINFSNTYRLERKMGWSGVLIEPALNRYLELIENRARVNYFVCSACVPFDFDSGVVRMYYGDQMTIGSNSERLSDEYLSIASQSLKLSGARAALKTPIEFVAIAQPLSRILDDANAPEIIDLFSLDVEGAELGVLQGIDFDKYRFKLIVVETADVDPIREFLGFKGYSLSEQVSIHDYVFVHSSSRSNTG